MNISNKEYSESTTNPECSYSHINNIHNYGFFRVGAAVPEVKLADPDKNAVNIVESASRLNEMGVDLIVFPELCVTGYTCADLFSQSLLLDSAEKALLRIADLSAKFDCCLVVGAPLRKGSSLFNCGVVICAGNIVGVVPKRFIPNYSEFYEKRWFSPAPETNSFVSICGNDYPFGTQILFNFKNACFGIEICEDLWVPQPPSSSLCMAGADIVANLSASDENIGKHIYLTNLIAQQSGRGICGYVYSGAGIGESSTDLVFSGNAIVADNGSIDAKSPRFVPGTLRAVADIDIERLRNDRRRRDTYLPIGSTEGYHMVNCGRPNCGNPNAETLIVPPSSTPFIPSDKSHLTENCMEIFSIQAWGLMQRMRATGMRHAVIGISGGLDSTLALLVAVKTFKMLELPLDNIIGITMPGFGTTYRTHSNAWMLMQELGVTAREIPIGEAVNMHFKDIGHNPNKLDATYENSQARERTQILMDVANQEGALVVGTGDLSELALGWCTYNADQMSMYGVNASVPKTLVRHLIEWFAEFEASPKVKKLLHDIADTPISPELLPANADGSINQKTEDLVGPYILHDFFLFHTLRNGFSPRKIFWLAKMAFNGAFSDPTLKKWLSNFYRRFFSQQFKRSAMPDGPKVGSVCLSPRGDWRMPSDASSALWLREVEEISAENDSK